MTEQEIRDIKTRISHELSSRLEKAFLGQSITEASAPVIKGYLERTLQDLIETERLYSVFHLIDWVVTFSGRDLHVVMEPKKGCLSTEQIREAQDFIYNRGSDTP